MTRSQKRILRFIRRGPTTRRAIVLHLGLAYATAQVLRDLDVLESAGEITCQLNISGEHIRAVRREP